MNRFLPGLLTAALIITIAGLTYLYWGTMKPEAIAALLADNRWAPLVFVLAHIVASLAFFPPRLIMAVAGGLIFGLWAGAALSLFGAVAGAVAGFALVRYLHRGVFALDGKRGLSWLTLLKKRLDGGGWRGVALVRLMPVPGTPINYAFGLTEISFTDYLSGTAIGLLPSTLFCADLGAAGGQALNGTINLLQPTLVGLAAITASIALPRLLRLLRRA